MRISDWSSDVCSSDLAVPLVRRLMKEAGVVPTGGATGANRFNLSGPWLAAMQRIYGGTRLGRQELHGAMLDDVEGPPWTRPPIDRCRGGAGAGGHPVRAEKRRCGEEGGSKWTS